MVDKVSQVPSNYTTPQLPEVGVSAPIDQGTDWASIIKTVGTAYGGVKTEQFMNEQEASTESLRVAHATDKRIADISIARNIMEKQAAGAITAEDTKELERINKDYGNLLAAVEQGRQTQRGFELKAQALLRESIRRRPDLAKELNDMYSKAVGTPSLEMLQHRYFAEDLNWVGQAAKAKEKGITDADVSRISDDILALSKVLPNKDQADVITGALMQSAAIRARGGSSEEAMVPLKDPAVQSILGTADGKSSTQEYLRLTEGTRDFDRKLDGFYGVAFDKMPNSPEWMNMVGTARQMITVYEAENVSLGKMRDDEKAKQKIAQNNYNVEYLRGIIAMADNPQKAANLVQSRNTFNAMNIEPMVKSYLSWSLSDYSEDARAPIAESFKNGENARKYGYHLPGSPISSPASLQLFAGNLARNPKGERMQSQELTGNRMLLTGLLADWGSPIKNEMGQYVPRSVEDFTNPRQGVLASIKSMIPAMNNTYMTPQLAKENPVQYTTNLLYMAGVLDQANIAMHKRLESEGLSQFIKRGSFQKSLENGTIPDFGKGIMVVGKPSAEQRARIDELVGGLNLQIQPIGIALKGFAQTIIPRK